MLLIFTIIMLVYQTRGYIEMGITWAEFFISWETPRTAYHVRVRGQESATRWRIKGEEDGNKMGIWQCVKTNSTPFLFTSK